MFEIKIHCTCCNGWEDTPVFLTGDECVFSYDASEQFNLVMFIAQYLADLFHEEVRWNWKGNGQGHYVEPHLPQAEQPEDPCQLCLGCEILRDCPAEISQEVNHYETAFIT